MSTLNWSSSFISFFILHDHLIILILICLNLHIAKAEIEVRNNQNSTVQVINDFEIGYAELVPLDGINARLVLAQPEDACTPIAGPPSTSYNDSMKWFVIVHRYPCLLQQKIGYAIQAGYDGIIIFAAHDSSIKSYSPSDNSSTIIANSANNITNSSSKPPSRSLKGLFEYVDPLFISTGAVYSIPVLLVSSVDGSLLVNEYLYDKDYHVFISSNLSFDINDYLMPFAIIIGLCISVMFCFMVLQIVRCIRNHRRGNKHRLKKKYLKQIPTTKYTKGDQFDTCAICLEEYIEGEKLRVLPCGHLYHLKCIDPWLTKNRKVCPVCKGKVILPGMSDDSDSEMETEGNEDSANERTPLISNSNPEASTSNRRINNYSGTQSSNFRFRVDRSTQVHPLNRNSSILTSVEADITPITLAPEHSVNCEVEIEPSSEDNNSENHRLSRDRHSGGAANTSTRNLTSSGRSTRQDVIV